MSGLGDLPRPYSQRDRARAPMVKELVKAVDWKAQAKKWVTLRFLPIDLNDPNSLAYTGTVWVNKEIEKDGKVKEVSFSRIAGGFDPKTGKFKTVKGKQVEDPFIANGKGRLDTRYVLQAIVRDIPTSGKKSKPAPDERKGLLLGTATWTPVRVVDLPQSVVNAITAYKALNKVKKKDGKVEEYDVTHPIYGCDIMLKFDPDAKGPQKWAINKGERSKLSDEELKYARWSLSPVVEAYSSLTPEQAQTDYNKEFKIESTGAEKQTGNYYTDEDTDDIDLEKPAAKKKVKPSKKLVSKKAAAKPAAKSAKSVKSKVSTKPKKKVVDDSDMPF